MAAIMPSPGAPAVMRGFTQGPALYWETNPLRRQNGSCDA